MIRVVFVGRDKEVFVNIEQTLMEEPVEIDWCDSGKSALTLLSEKTEKKPIDLVITDETLPDMGGRELVEKVITQSPMTNCVAASSLSHKQFHDDFEGLGVLMQLPLKPTVKDGQKLLTYLKKIINLTT
jgi:two-component SAPR family response regulator